MPKNLTSQLEGSEFCHTGGAVRVQAAAGGEKIPTASIVAYTGGVMTPQLPPIKLVVDLAGASAEAGVCPLIRDHDAGKVLGQGPITVEAKRVLMRASLCGPAAYVDEVVEAANKGFEWRASIEGSLRNIEFVDEGDTIKVNGRKVQGPVYVAREAHIVSVSIVSLAGDQATSTKIAARKGREGSTMAKRKSQQVVEPVETIEDDPADEREEILAAERKRVTEIRAAAAECEGLEALEAKAISDGWSVDEFKSKAFDAGSMRARRELIRANRPNIPIGRPASTAGLSREVLSAGILIRAGHETLAAKHYGDRATTEARSRFRHVMDILEASLQLDGRHSGAHGKDEIIRAAFSGLDAPIAFGDAGRMMLMSSYNETPRTWDKICKKVSTVDFRPVKVLHPNIDTGNLDDKFVAPTGELKHVSIGEKEYNSAQVNTVGVLMSVTRADLINDQLGIFHDAASTLGTECSRWASDLFVRKLLSGSGSHFADPHNNFMHDAASVLSFAGLSTAALKLRTQRDASGRSIDLVPKTILVPPELEITARSVVDSDILQRYVSSNADNRPTANPLQGISEICVEPRLSNPLFTGYSQTAWYLFAGIEAAAVHVAFLNDQVFPTVEYFGMDADPAHLGVTWRVFWDLGFSLGDEKAAVMSLGQEG